MGFVVMTMRGQSSETESLTYNAAARGPHAKGFALAASVSSYVTVGVAIMDKVKTALKLFG
jgi:hypothetical protein